MSLAGVISPVTADPNTAPDTGGSCHPARCVSMRPRNVSVRCASAKIGSAARCSVLRRRYTLTGSTSTALDRSNSSRPSLVLIPNHAALQSISACLLHGNCCISRRGPVLDHGAIGRPRRQRLIRRRATAPCDPGEWQREPAQCGHR
jgi:hypothetical protein